MRLFVAVRPPEPVLDEVARVAAVLHDGAGVRPIPRSNWHITLRFLGEVADPEPVSAALGRLRLQPAEATLGPMVTVLGRRVVAIPVDGLESLAAAVATATATFGEPVEDRPFRGHVTLARLTRGTQARQVRAAVGTPIAVTWTAEEITLVRSHVSSSGAVYEDLQSWPLLR